MKNNKTKKVGMYVRLTESSHKKLKKESKKLNISLNQLFNLVIEKQIVLE